MNTGQLAKICQLHSAILLSVGPDRLRIATGDAPDDGLLQALRFASQLPVEVEQWSAKRMEKQRQIMPELTPPGAADDAVGTLNSLLEQAIARRASDIHLEPGAEVCQVRLRTDGMLQPVPALDTALASALSTRLKVLAGLDIAERRIPQDGQFSCPIAGLMRSFRLSTLPCQYGEKLVLRLLEIHNQALSLETLGLNPRQLETVYHTLQQPQGLVLVTGPTGSGKTVTLYGALKTIGHPGINVCSVEDPIEIPVPGLNQTQINAKAGLSFQRVLRALLRQDPDVIMIGEIRDAETATIALNAAQTGHLVLSTLHTNSTAETLTRLSQMAIPPWMVAASLKLVVAQRLARKLCPHCKIRLADDVTLPSTLWPSALPRWQAKGCEHCYSGYYGRLALFEVMPLSDALREAILARHTVNQLAGIAAREGMNSLWESGFDAVSRGLTTVEEIWRTVGAPHGIA